MNYFYVGLTCTRIGVDNIVGMQRFLEISGNFATIIRYLAAFPLIFLLAGTMTDSYAFPTKSKVHVALFYLYR